MDITSYQKIDSSPFLVCVTPSLLGSQTTYKKNIFSNSFLKICLWYSFSVSQPWLTWEGSLELNPLIQNSVQQDYLPELYPPVSPFRLNMFSLLSSCFIAPIKCRLPCPFPKMFVGYPGDEVRILPSSQKNSHFPHQKNLPY